MGDTMKKLFILIFILGIVTGCFYSEKNSNKKVDESTVIPDMEPSKNEYIDNNPIIVGLYKYYGSAQDRKLIKEYTKEWTYHNDISSFEVFYTNDESISGKLFKDTFKNYLDNYSNIDNYKIGYHVSFMTKDKEFNETILSPKDTEKFFEYLEVYLYDDYNREKGVWYSHTTEEEMGSETILTSIKLTAGMKISEIISDINLTVFTYDYDDFFEDGSYRGKSKYSIIVKNNKTEE